MELSDLTIRLIVLFLPGALAGLIVKDLTVHKKWSTFEFSLNTIILGFSSYFGYFLLRVFVNLFGCNNFASYEFNFWKSLFDHNIPVDLSEVIYACLASIIVGLATTGFINHKILFRLSRYFKLTEKYGDENLYSYYLNSPDINWVWVRDIDSGYTYEGMVASFSENETFREIVLQQVKVYNDSSKEAVYEVPSLYLTLSHNAIIQEPPPSE